MNKKTKNLLHVLKTKKVAGIVGTSVVAVGLSAGIFVANNNQTPTVLKAAEAKVSYVDSAEFKKGSDITFQIKYQVPNDKSMKNLVFYDQLEPVYTHLKTRIFDGKTDVTDQFTLDFDKKNNTTNAVAKKPMDWFGKVLTMRVETNLQKNADLSKYLDKNTNQYNIPNIGNMVVDDQNIPSPPVFVTPPNDKEPTVVKTIEDRKGNFGESAEHDPGEEYKYQVVYSIPDNGKSITNIQFNDDLEDVLELGDVVVKDDKGRDITKEDGVLTKDENKESFNWQANKEFLEEMAGKKYTVTISSKVKPDADPSKYLDKDVEPDQIRVPNVANMIYNDETIPSPPAYVIPPVPNDAKVVKSVKGLEDKYSTESANVEIGKEYSYKIDFTLPTGTELKDVEFNDDLEDVLDLKKVVVKNSNDKDITESDGTLKVDDKEETFNWTPGKELVDKMQGTTYSVYVTAEVKNDANRESYLKNNTILIPNTAHMLYNGEDLPSNTPNVTPKTEQPTTKKGIIKDPKQWSSVFSSSSAEHVVTDKQAETVQNEQDNADSEKTYKIVSAIEKLDNAKPASNEDLLNMTKTPTVLDNEADFGDKIEYLVTAFTGNSEKLDSLVLSDDLEDVLDLNAVIVMDSEGNNITNDGQLSIGSDDETFTWVASHPEKYTNKTLYVAIDATLKKDANVKDYDDGKIPNQAHQVINGKDNPSNLVHTSTPETPESEKPKDPEDPKTPANPLDPANPKGVLPQTGKFVIEHLWAILSVLTLGVAGLGYWLYKKNKDSKNEGWK